MAHIIWTRAGTAAGEDLEDIIHRKERERNALGGIFFWQVGNAPPEGFHALRKRPKQQRPNIQVTFSEQKTKPRKEHELPDSVLLWKSYFHWSCGETLPLPEGVVVTSGGWSCCPYALVCKTEKPLDEQWGSKRKKCFDPSLLNRSSNTREITALFERSKKYRDKPKKKKWMHGYKKDMKAELDWDYGGWVCLQNPTKLDMNKWDEWKKKVNERTGDSRKGWRDIVRQI